MRGSYFQLREVLQPRTLSTSTRNDLSYEGLDGTSPGPLFVVVLKLTRVWSRMSTSPKSQLVGSTKPKK